MAPSDSSVVSALLSRLAGTLDGLIDTGTSLCVSPARQMIEDFHLHRIAVISSIIVVLRDFLGTEASRQPLSAMLDAFNAECGVLYDTFSVVRDFRKADLKDLACATEALRQSYNRFRNLIRGVGSEVGVGVPYLETRTGGHNHYIRILDNLFELLRAERASAT